MIIGPKVTLLSRMEGGAKDWKGKGKQAEEKPEPTEKELRKAEKDRLESGRRRLIQVIGESGKEGWRAELDIAAAATAGAAERGREGVPTAYKIEALPNGTSRPLPTTERHGTRSSIARLLNPGAPAPPTPSFFRSESPEELPPPPRRLAKLPPLPPPTRLSDGTDEVHTRNYVIVSEFDGATDLSEEFAGIFGEQHQPGAVDVISDDARTSSQSSTFRCS